MERFLWLDMEMTGLDPVQHRIIEVGAVVTDRGFHVLESWGAVVFQPKAFLDAMDDWNVRHHTDSGLLERIPSGVPLADVESRLLEMVERWFPVERPVLCGNSIHQDRRFVEAWLPRFGKTLHYRMLDVSSFKIIFEAMYGEKYLKKGTHRAEEDIAESIAEMKHYLKFIGLPHAAP